VYFGRQSEKIKAIVSFNDLICKLQVVPRWKKTLRYSDFSLSGEFEKEDLRDVTSDTTLAAVPATTASGEMKLILKLNSKGFSEFKNSQEEALSSIGSLFNKLEYIPRDNSRFPQVAWSQNLSEVDFNAILSRVTEDIMYRNEVIDRELASEYTMREFIGPVLIGALRLVQLFLKKTGNIGRLSLICEKIIVGLHARGPVDYVVVFDCLDIILTEAKKLAISEGVIQNLLQQRASQEFLTNVLLDFDETGESRKRCFQDAFDKIASTATCGCATTGSEWIFTKIRYDNKSKQSVVEISDKYTIDLGSKKEDLQQSIEPILSIFVKMTMDQIDAVAQNEGLAERRHKKLHALSVFNLQAKEGNAVETEINESQVADKEDM
jgi:Mor family transcriptional regulator